MYWTSFADFLAMGQHGLYVWGSFAVMALAMAIEPLLLVSGRRKLLARLQRQFRAEFHADQTERIRCATPPERSGSSSGSQS